MLNLTKEEKLVLVFLTACFIVGSGVNFYKKRFEITSLPLAPQHDIKRADFKIDINRTTFNELIKLKGIGGKIAERIIDYRRKNGRFFYKEDLMKVKGIGKAKFNAIKDKIIVE